MSSDQGQCENKKALLVKRLLTPIETQLVAGGGYAQKTSDYCRYSQSFQDPAYKQNCMLPEFTELSPN